MIDRGEVQLSAAGMDLTRELGRWHPLSQPQAALRDDYLTFLRNRGATGLRKTGGGEHVTASCFVFTPDFSNVLLCFHKKGQFWVQLGGHVEPLDHSVAAAAFREGAEESGTLVSPVSRQPLDVDRHALGDGFGSCSVHWDVGFAAVADPQSELLGSDESDDVRWWPVNALPASVPDGFPARVERILAAVATVATV